MTEVVKETDINADILHETHHINGPSSYGNYFCSDVACQWVAQNFFRTEAEKSFIAFHMHMVDNVTVIDPQRLDMEKFTVRGGTDTSIFIQCDDCRWPIYWGTQITMQNLIKRCVDHKCIAKVGGD